MAFEMACTRLTLRAFGCWWVLSRFFITLVSGFHSISWITSWPLCPGKFPYYTFYKQIIKVWFLFTYSNSTMWHVLMCTLVAFIYWVVICLTMRYTLKLLLMYKGWMYESRGSGSRVSLSTKAWAVLVKGKEQFCLNLWYFINFTLFSF